MNAASIMPALRHILAADDHEVARRGIRDVLEESFPLASLEQPADFRELRKKLDARPWDLIILDVMMPEGNIVDALHDIRARMTSTPILILTATTEITFVRETLRAGANGVVHKHQLLDDLMHAIRDVVGGRTYVDPGSAAEIAKEWLEPPMPAVHLRLSEREMDVFRAIALGQTLKEIALSLDLSDKTVATYLGRLREKTGLTSHVEIARYALKNGIVE